MRGWGVWLTLALAACTRPTPPSPAVQAALKAADAAVAAGKVPPANTLSKELQAYAGQKDVPAAFGEKLRALASDCEAMNGVPPASLTPYWERLRPRLELAGQGKDPGPGPRFRPDLPLAVSTAIGEAENALRDANQDAACAAIDQVTMELSDFSWTVPAPRNQPRLRKAVEILDPIPETCRTAPLVEAKLKFEAALRELGP